MKQLNAKPMVGAILLVVVISLLIASGTMVRMGLYDVDVLITNDANETRFELNAPNVNQISWFSLHSTKEPRILWKVRKFDATRANLVYGRPPAGAEQIFPAHNEPPRKLEDGEELYITVGFDLDVLLTAGSGSRYFAFRYSDKSGSIPCQRAKWSDIPR